jgi:hypothetical protein
MLSKWQVTVGDMSDDHIAKRKATLEYIRHVVETSEIDQLVNVMTSKLHNNRYTNIHCTTFRYTALHARVYLNYEAYIIYAHLVQSNVTYTFTVLTALLCFAC